MTADAPEVVAEVEAPAQKSAEPLADESAQAAAFTDVGKTFADGTEALTGVSLQVRHAEFVALVGPSGCGKSTVLRLLSGLSSPTTGTVSVDVEPRELGHVFQDPTLLPWRTVARNVELLAELTGLTRDERRARAQTALDRVGLADFAGHRPHALSGGMRMRVSLARALTMKPRLFCFDEPFGALDEITRDRLATELSTLFATERFASVFVTHSVTEAVYLADRVLVMSPRPGRLVAEVAVPFEHPRDPELRYSPELAKLAGEVSAHLAAGRSS